MNEQQEVGEQEGIFIFPEREEDETPQHYYQRAIMSNSERGVPIQEIAKVMGKVTGDKEEREGIHSLTRMPMRSVFERDLEREFENMKRIHEKGSERRIALIIVDIDNFKNYNDEHGYFTGDKVLLGMAGVLTALEFVPGRTIHCYHWGGEEFTIIVRNEAADEAEEIAREIREQVTKRTGVTVSAGVARVNPQGDTGLDLFWRANVAVSIAKGKTSYPTITGQPKDRTVTWEKGMPTTLLRFPYQSLADNNNIS